MKEKVEGRTKDRIKRSSFTHEVTKLQKDYPAVLTIPTLALSKQDYINPCENTTSEIQINTTNSASPEIIWGPGGPEEDHQIHHCCWTGRVGERKGDDS